MTDAARLKFMRDFWRENGRCSVCGSVLDRDGATCTYCNEQNKRRDRLLKVRRVEEGRCCDCGKENDNLPKNRCKACAVMHRKYNQRLKEFRRANGLCVQCGEPTKDGKRLCEVHNDRKLELRRKNNGK